MRNVTLSLKAPPQSWVKHLLGLRGITVKILDCQPDNEDKESMYEFFEIRCRRELMPEVVRRLHNAEEVGELEINIKSEAGLITGSLKTLRCNLCKHFTSKGCFMGSAIYDIEQDRIIWSLYIRDKYFPQLLNALSIEGIDFRIDESTPLNIQELLTAKQEALLMTALREGYFDSPRRTNSHKLAEELGLSPPALSVGLRRALKRILQNYFLEKTSSSPKI